MKRLWLLLLLSAATPLANCEQSTKSSATSKPDEGNFFQNTYRNDFFGLSYSLPGEWHKSNASPALLPAGSYYLFIGDRHTGHHLMNRVVVIADAESNYSSISSAHEYVSAIVRRQLSHASGEVMRQTSPFAAGENRFDRADYKMVQDGTTHYKSLVCTNRSGYWLSWTFVAQSERELDDVVNTLQHVSFDHGSPR
jgi:hypothetical protein